MYKDRGIIKWAPFDALAGFRSMIAERSYIRGKKEQPLLSEDKLEQIDRVFKEAINLGQEIMISYYTDGYIKETFGHIICVDLQKRLIKLSSMEMIVLDVICDAYTMS